MKTFTSTKAPAAIGPYSQAVSANGTVYVSGQLPVCADTGILETDIRKATARCLENISAILGEASLTLADSLKLTLFLADMADFAAMNEIYSGYFTAPFPARVCVAVAALPKNARIEIDCVAAAGSAPTAGAAAK